MADIELVIKIPEEIYKASQIVDVKYEDVVQIPLEIIANGTPLDEIRAEIAEYKDDMIIHAESNEMIDIVLDIIDKYKAESEDAE